MDRRLAPHGRRPLDRLWTACLGRQGCDPVLAHSVYRIVQELLTNARKHAPTELVWLQVCGGPGEGIRIESSNVLTRGAAVATEVAGANGTRSARWFVDGAGSGLRGFESPGSGLRGIDDPPPRGSVRCPALPRSSC